MQEWVGHADIQTTMRYLHYARDAGDARLVAEAFAVDASGDISGISGRFRGNVPPCLTDPGC